MTEGPMLDVVKAYSGSIEELMIEIGIAATRTNDVDQLRLGLEVDRKACVGLLVQLEIAQGEREATDDATTRQIEEMRAKLAEWETWGADMEERLRSAEWRAGHWQTRRIQHVQRDDRGLIRDVIVEERV